VSRRSGPRRPNPSEDKKLRGFTQAIIMGNLTADPDVKDVGESKVANFKVAVNRKWRDRAGELQEAVDFISVVAWNNTAENVEKYLKKGDPVFVEGRLEEDRWESNEGQKRSKIQIVARTVTFLSRPPKDEPEETADEDSFK